MVHYDQIVSEAFRFAIQPKRWLPVVVANVIFLAIFLWFVLPAFIEIFLGLALRDSGAIVSGMLVSLALFIPAALVNITLLNALMKQASDEVDWKTSIRFGIRKIPWCIMLVILITLISVVVGLPFSFLSSQSDVLAIAIQQIISLVINLGFFLSFAILVVRDTHAWTAVKVSWTILRRKPLHLILLFVLTLVISWVIAGISLIPALAVAWGVIVPAMFGVATDPGALILAISSLLSDLPTLFAVGALAVAGIAVAGIFSLAADVKFYRELQQEHGF